MWGWSGHNRELRTPNQALVSYTYRSRCLNSLIKKSILNGDNLQKLVLGGSGEEITVVVQSLSRVRLFATPWIASLSFLQSLFKLMSIESGMLSNHLILCHPPIMLFMYKACGAHKQIHSISEVLKFNEKCDQEKKCLIWLLEIEKKWKKMCERILKKKRRRNF